MPQTKTTLKEMLVQQQAEHAQQGMQYQESRVQNRNSDLVVAIVFNQDYFYGNNYGYPPYMQQHQANNQVQFSIGDARAAL